MSETIFLRFPSEIEAQLTLMAFGAGPDDGESFASYGTGTWSGHRYDYVVVNLNGAIWRRAGGTDDEPVMEQAPGYHVNVLWHGPPELIPDFGAARVFPVTPECVFRP